MNNELRFTRGEVRALLASLDCFANDPLHVGNTLWWKKEPIERATTDTVRQKLLAELEKLK